MLKQPISRRILVSSVGIIAVGALASAVSGCKGDTMTDRQLTYTALDDAMRETDRLAKIADLDPGTVWSLPQTLVHCAQSIEFSLHGFPQPKSALFQTTVGAAAFRAFSWRGRMSHNLAEAIPGAPTLDGKTNLAAALARLQTAVQDFRASKGPLKPHFAYGSLSKAQYEQAHAMHLANHFSAINA